MVNSRFPHSSLPPPPPPPANALPLDVSPEATPIVGMIHVGALPGTPANAQSISELAAQARAEAHVYRSCGVDGVMIENMHDVPYLRGLVGPEIVAAMNLPQFATEFNVPTLKANFDIAVRQKLAKPFNLEAMIWKP